MALFYSRGSDPLFEGIARGHHQSGFKPQLDDQPLQRISTEVVNGLSSSLLNHLVGSGFTGPKQVGQVDAVMTSLGRLPPMVNDVLRRAHWAPGCDTSDIIGTVEPELMKNLEMMIPVLGEIPGAAAKYSVKQDLSKALSDALNNEGSGTPANGAYRGLFDQFETAHYHLPVVVPPFALNIKGEDRGIFDMLSNVASSVAKHVVPFVMNHVVPTAISAIQSASSDRGLPEQFEKLHALTGTITAELAEELKKNRAKLDPSGKAPGVSDEEHVKQALVKIATPVVMARVVPAVAALQAPKGAFGAEPTHVEIDRLPAIISTLQPVVEGAVESGVTHAANTDRGFFSGLIKAAKGAVTTAVHAATTVATKGAEFLSNHPEIASLAKTALTDGVKLAAAA